MSIRPLDVPLLLPRIVPLLIVVAALILNTIAPSAPVTVLSLRLRVIFLSIVKGASREISSRRTIVSPAFAASIASARDE